MSEILVLAPPQSRRLKAYQQSLADYGLPQARVLSYRDYLTSEVSLTEHVRENTIFRIESSGEDFETERLILIGGDVEDEEGDVYTRLSQKELRHLTLDVGALLPSRQWFLGYRNFLKRIEKELASCPPHRLMNHPKDIIAMFDKRETHRRLEQAGVKVPPSLGVVNSFTELHEAMCVRNWKRVFIKLAHGSSASGAVALETNGKQWQATTTVEMVQENSLKQDRGLKLYNSRKLLKYRNLNDIQNLINALCKHRVHVEQWLPKAGMDGHVFDLRVVVIGQKAQHVLVRLGRGAMTNLHLKNKRGDWDKLRRLLDDDVWQSVKTSCEQALQCFPNSLYAGADVLLTPSLRQHAILELNAFGDYHRKIYVEGLDTFGAELKALGFNVGQVEA